MTIFRIVKIFNFIKKRNLKWGPVARNKKNSVGVKTNDPTDDQNAKAKQKSLFDSYSSSDSIWSVQNDAAINPRSQESEVGPYCTKKTNDQNRKDRKDDKAPKKESRRYPGTGSSFSIRPLTPEMPQTVTTISIINPTENRVTS